MTFSHGSTMYPPAHSPWGSVQTRDEIGRGIWRITTASHGGLWLEPDTYAMMPDSCKRTPYSAGGWYEEDCDALLVDARFPEIIHAPYTLADVHGWLQKQASYFTMQRLNDLGVPQRRRYRRTGAAGTGADRPASDTR